MNSRERVRRAIAFRAPDRIPYFHRFLDATRERYPELVSSIEARYPGDMASSCWYNPAIKVTSSEREGAHLIMDEWGCTRATGIEGLTGIAVDHPLADYSALEGYEWPDYRDLCDWDRVADVLRQDPELYHAGMKPILNPFERMQALRGFERLMFDLAENRPELYELRDRVVEVMIVVVNLWAQTDVDAVNFGDDWGTQTNLMISPQMWRTFFRPVYERLFEPVKRAGKFIQFHSCGMVLPIIPELIDLGVDIVNVQHNLIGLDCLRQFCGEVCFLTAMDSQLILPYRSPVDVRQHVREVFEALGTRDGGIIGYAPLGPDVLPENIEALYAAYVEFGAFP